MSQKAKFKFEMLRAWINLILVGVILALGPYGAVTELGATWAVIVVAALACWVVYLNRDEGTGAALLALVGWSIVMISTIAGLAVRVAGALG